MGCICAITLFYPKKRRFRMTKKLLLLILTFSVISCQSQTNQKYAESLRNCLTESDLKILNKATYEFEQKLSKHYGSADNNQNFLSYLTKLASLHSSNIKADFFLNEKSINILNELEEGGTFKKIWTEFVEDLEEIPITVVPGYKEEEEEKLEIYVLNPDGDYFKCINENTNNRFAKKILNSQSEYGDIAPLLIAISLRQNMRKSDFDDGLNKVIVAIGFYYHIVNLLNKNPK